MYIFGQLCWTYPGLLVVLLPFFLENLLVPTAWTCRLYRATWDAQRPTDIWCLDRAVTTVWSLCAACTYQKQLAAKRTFFLSLNIEDISPLFSNMSTPWQEPTEQLISSAKEGLFEWTFFPHVHQAWRAEPAQETGQEYWAITSCLLSFPHSPAAALCLSACAASPSQQHCLFFT